MKKNKNTNLIFIFIIIIMIGLLAYYLSRSENNLSSSYKTSENDKINTQETENIRFDGLVYFQKYIEDHTELYSINANKEEKLIYSDKDDELKIKHIAGVTNDKEILVFMGPSDGTYTGGLYIIKNSEKNKLDFSFASSGTSIVSQDFKKIAYQIFSNVEFNYGYTLYTLDIDGNSKLKIASNDTNIDRFSFNFDSSKIAYCISNDLYVYDFTSNETQKISDFKNDYQITQIYWNSQENILVTQKNEKLNKTIVSKANIDNQKITDLTTIDELITGGAIWMDSDTSFAYTSKDNKIVVYKDKIFQILSDANLLISWQK